jgi:hypothetical protein
MGISRMTALTIQNWPDTDSPEKDGLLVSSGHGKEDTAKWGSILYLCKDGEIHTMVLSSAPVFDSAEEAEESMRKTMSDIRSMEL